ncbi:hypothetical protein EVAR_24135_1 [Eumeta japonica]|uniref:Uncharacterized protein n=1 Tax=Eumeta variegata TaxID=151549 RepID=A0A4C1YMP5_EUMVA|nr:hypothetical protein EVAR_24135_1 [Eumeta japonica]
MCREPTTALAAAPSPSSRLAHAVNLNYVILFKYNLRTLLKLATRGRELSDRQGASRSPNRIGGDMERCVQSHRHRVRSEDVPQRPAAAGAGTTMLGMFRTGFADRLDRPALYGLNALSDVYAAFTAVERLRFARKRRPAADRISA